MGSTPIYKVSHFQLAALTLALSHTSNYAIHQIMPYFDWSYFGVVHGIVSRQHTVKSTCDQISINHVL